MKVDFFVEECRTDNISSPRFGICDPGNHLPACVSHDNEDTWVAVVENQSGKAINFTAIDNCIEIRRENGEMDNRCDAMLTNPDTIIFIELKVQDKDWIHHAVNVQLQSTIDHFKANHAIEKFRRRIAYACNRRHPQFQYSRMELLNEFRRRNGVRLNIVNTIVVK